MIIGFSGSMGVGKSTAIEVIREAAGRDKVALSKFAQPIYNIQEAIYKEISPVYQRPVSFVKDRKLLQWIGTDWARETISPTVWVDLWKANVQDLIKTHPYIVCDDVRFDNEAELVRSMGGIVIQIQGPTRGAVPGLNFHSSERGVNKDLVDYVLVNEGGKEAFKDAVYSLFQEIGDPYQ